MKVSSRAMCFGLGVLSFALTGSAVKSAWAMGKQAPAADSVVVSYQVKSNQFLQTYSPEGSCRILGGTASVDVVTSGCHTYETAESTWANLAAELSGLESPGHEYRQSCDQETLVNCEIPKSKAGKLYYRLNGRTEVRNIKAEKSYLSVSGVRWSERASSHNNLLCGPSGYTIRLLHPVKNLTLSVDLASAAECEQMKNTLDSLGMNQELQLTIKEEQAMVGRIPTQKFTLERVDFIQ